MLLGEAIYSSINPGTMKKNQRPQSVNTCVNSKKSGEKLIYTHIFTDPGALIKKHMIERDKDNVSKTNLQSENWNTLNNFTNNFKSTQGKQIYNSSSSFLKTVNQLHGDNTK
jgi:hypothetical protein